jgi:hypothetical protein
MKKLDNIKRIEDNGFEVIGEYKGCHYPILVKCHCGKEFTGYANHLVYGRRKSCGCHFTAGETNWTGYKSISGKQFYAIKQSALDRRMGRRRGRKIEFNITIEDIWNKYIEQDRKCIYTGIDLYWTFRKQTGNASVDRIDSNKNYTYDNIQIVHKDVNLMKQSLSNDFFIYLCSLISNKFYDKNKFLENEIKSIEKIEQQYEDRFDHLT